MEKLFTYPIENCTVGTWRNVDTYVVDVAAKGKFMDKYTLLTIAFSVVSLTMVVAILPIVGHYGDRALEHLCARRRLLIDDIIITGHSTCPVCQQH